MESYFPKINFAMNGQNPQGRFTESGTTLGFPYT